MVLIFVPFLFQLYFLVFVSVKAPIKKACISRAFLILVNTGREDWRQHSVVIEASSLPSAHHGQLVHLRQTNRCARMIMNVCAKQGTMTLVCRAVTEAAHLAVVDLILTSLHLHLFVDDAQCLVRRLVRRILDHDEFTGTDLAILMFATSVLIDHFMNFLQLFFFTI